MDKLSKVNKIVLFENFDLKKINKIKHFCLSRQRCQNKKKRLSCRCDIRYKVYGSHFDRSSHLLHCRRICIFCHRF